MALLDIHDLEVRFGGVTALSGVDMSVRAGVVHGLIGPNGAGKTTLFNCISRLVEPAAGTIHFDGKDLARLAAHDVAAAGVSRSFQNLGLIGQLSVIDNVKVGLHACHPGTLKDELMFVVRRMRYERETAERAMAALRLVGIEQFAHLPVSALSYGARKLVEFARAVVGESKLLLLDEPTAGLSPFEMSELRVRIDALRAARPITLLVITHHLEFLAEIADTVTVLDLGKAIASGTPNEIRTDPAVVSAYLGEEADASH